MCLFTVRNSMEISRALNRKPNGSARINTINRYKSEIDKNPPASLRINTGYRHDDSNVEQRPVDDFLLQSEKVTSIHKAWLESLTPDYDNWDSLQLTNIHSL